jgi:glycosyltransferase involved in cell wall biosynthesis
MTVSLSAPAVTARRVGLLTYALDRATGGIARYTRELRAALLRQGVPLTTLQAGRSPARSDGTVRLAGAGLLPGLMTIGQVEIGLAARTHDLALVHDPTGVSPLMLTSARRVATIHDVIPLIHPTASTLLDRLIYRRWLPSAARHLDAIITVSEHSRRDIIRLLGVDPTRVHVVPNAVSPSFQPVDRAVAAEVARRHQIDGPYILYVGSIEARKNLPRLLQAFRRLRSWDSRWQLVIVGVPGWKATPVYATVQQLGLGSSVVFTGYVPDAELPALYSGADLFVFPSLYEGCGLPVLEAMACGTPVVTSSTSSLPEVAGDAAFLCDPEDEAAIAEAMRAMLDDAGRRQKMADLGRERARGFCWDRSARETLDVYDIVLADGRRQTRFLERRLEP